MIKKTLLALVFLFAISSAASPAWHGTAILAIFTSLILLALLYVIGTGFSINELQILAKEEVYQVIALIVLLVILTGTDNILNMISTTSELRTTAPTMQDAALLSLNDSLKNITSALNEISSIDNLVAKEGSQGLQCSAIGVGYSISACGGFAMLATPFSLVGSILGFAAGELFAAYRLIEISQAYAFTLLLPLGIILRTFRFTRGAGGLIIAIGIAIYLLLPLGIILVDRFGDAFKDSVKETDADHVYFEPASFSDPDCDEGTTLGDNEERAISTYNELRKSIKSYLFLVLVKGTLGPVIGILMMVSGIRAITALAGAEIDVSPLARLV